LVPQNINRYEIAKLYGPRDQLLANISAQRQECRDAVRNWGIKYNLITGNDDSTLFLLRLKKSDLSKYIADKSLINDAWKEIIQITHVGVAKINNVLRKEPLRSSFAQENMQDMGHQILSIGTDYFQDKPLCWGQVDVFQQSFSQLFMTYFEMQKLNRLRRLDQNEGRMPAMPPLTEKEFEAQYGIEPWVFVNQILNESGLDFEIDHPIDYSTTMFTPQLRKKNSGVELKFSELSSGERVLMSFSFCLYYSADNRQSFERPKLLLLDEIDAPLHPSMSRRIVETIQKTLVKEQNVNVIFCTHSPSTVAVSPEEAVYAMHVEKPGLHKLGKRQAINILTYEIPTLSIDFSGRRQVFVESLYHAERYDKLYRTLSSRIASERSLGFIAVGKNNKSAEM
jgi:AAA ATPase domain